MVEEKVPVLIVGACPAGLATAMFLARQQVSVLLVERDGNIPACPAAAAPTPRTMELFRIAGVAEQVLANKQQVNMILRRTAERHGASLRFRTELVSFEQNRHGVTAQLLDHRTEQTSTVHADYLVTAKVPAPHGDGRMFQVGADFPVRDGFDIAWRLTAVVRGEAGPRLLDSYEAERAPVPVGDRLRSGAVLAEPEPAADTPADPSGQPGRPAPHVPLTRRDKTLSTVDLFGDGWVLLTGQEGGVWHQAARRVADRLGVRLQTHGLGPDLTDPDGQLAERYGIVGGGASLVRPDGIVAWRSRYEVTDAANTLHGVLTTLLDRRRH